MYMYVQYYMYFSWKIVIYVRSETRCSGGVSVPCLASRTRNECPLHNESVYIEAWHSMYVYV